VTYQMTPHKLILLIYQRTYLRIYQRIYQMFEGTGINYWSHSC